MARRSDPTSRKAVLAAAANAERLMGRELARGLRQAAAVIRDAASDPAIATSARARADAYRDVLVALADAGNRMTPELMRAINKRCEEVANGTAKALPDASPRRYELTEEQKVNAVNGRTAEQLVATQTQNMGEHAVRELREAVVEAMNRGRVEGWTADELQREIQAAWDRKAGDESAFRFVDRGGRSWSNATYLQMLCRTTMQKITRNQMAATLAGNGYDVARISSDGGGGDECDACSLWEGRLVSLTGATKGLPTLADAEADGVFHPNCVHRIEYVDDDELEDAIREDAARREEQEEEAPETAEEKPEWTPSTPLERTTDALMQSIGARHTDEDLPLSGVNPHFAENRRYRVNCQRCVPTAEARARGYDVEALPRIARNDPFFPRRGPYTPENWCFRAFKNPVAIPYTTKGEIESKMAEWGNGARAQICIEWRGGGAHTFMAVQESGKTRFFDPQSGRENYDPFRFISLRSRWSGLNNHFARVDNLEFSDTAKISFKAK